MTEYTRFVGVDISKTHLDVYVQPGGERLRLANTPAGAAALVARFPGAAFACEASGGHERTLLCAAVEAGAPAWRLHPADVRAFADFYRRLREAGKPHKIAIVATMRKLIVALKTMLKQNRDWIPA